MNMNELAMMLCKLEGGKSEVNIAQMKQILAKLCKLMAKNPKVLIAMLANGLK